MRLDGSQLMQWPHSGGSRSMQLVASRTLPAPSAIEVGHRRENEDYYGNELRGRDAGNESSWIVAPELNHKPRYSVERGVAQKYLAIEPPPPANHQQRQENQ